MARKLALDQIEGFRDYLFDAYIERRLTMKQIGNELCTTAPTILFYLRKYKIPTRECGEHAIGRKLSTAHIEAIKKRHTGKFVSEETRQKLSRSLKLLNRKSPNWNGGKRTGRTDEYIQVYKPEHPFASKDGYVMEHRLFLEEKLGRYLTSNEIAHHINGIRTDNRPENIQLMSVSEHVQYHSKKRWEKKREFCLLNR